MTEEDLKNKVEELESDLKTAQEEIERLTDLINEASYYLGKL